MLCLYCPSFCPVVGGWWLAGLVVFYNHLYAFGLLSIIEYLFHYTEGPSCREMGEAESGEWGGVERVGRDV